MLTVKPMRRGCAQFCYRLRLGIVAIEHDPLPTRYEASDGNGEIRDILKYR
jgi:hypothetical protein